MRAVETVGNVDVTIIISRRDMTKVTGEHLMILCDVTIKIV